MDRNTLNNNWTQTILYYCFQTDSSFHSSDCTDVGTWGYDEDYNLIVSTWLLGITQPTIETLMSYSLSNVTTFYENNYVLPSQINTNPFVSISASVLSSIPTSRVEEGKLFYNTTDKRIQFWNGSAYVNI